MTCRRSVRWHRGFSRALRRSKTFWSLRCANCSRKLFRSPNACSSMKLTRPNNSSKEFCKGRRRKQQFGNVFQRRLQRVGDDVARLVDVAQPVCLIDDHKVPPDRIHVGGLGPSELVGADDDGTVDFERPEVPSLDRVVVGSRFEYHAGQKELLLDFLVPLFAKVGWRNHQDAPLSFGPFLREDQARLDGLAETDFVCQQRLFRQRRVEGKQGGFDLVRVQIDLSVNERPASFSMLSDEHRLVSSCAKYFAWWAVRFIVQQHKTLRNHSHCRDLRMQSTGADQPNGRRPELSKPKTNQRCQEPLFKRERHTRAIGAWCRPWNCTPAPTPNRTCKFPGIRLSR